MFRTSVFRRLNSDDMTHSGWRPPAEQKAGRNRTCTINNHDETHRLTASNIHTVAQILYLIPRHPAKSPLIGLLLFNGDFDIDWCNI